MWIPLETSMLRLPVGDSNRMSSNGSALTRGVSIECSKRAPSDAVTRSLPVPTMTSCSSMVNSGLPFSERLWKPWLWTSTICAPTFTRTVTAPSGLRVLTVTFWVDCRSRDESQKKTSPEGLLSLVGWKNWSFRRWGGWRRLGVAWEGKAIVYFLK